MSKATRRTHKTGDQGFELRWGHRQNWGSEFQTSPGARSKQQPCSKLRLLVASSSVCLPDCMALRSDGVVCYDPPCVGALARAGARARTQAHIPTRPHAPAKSMSCWPERACARTHKRAFPRARMRLPCDGFVIQSISEACPRTNQPPRATHPKCHSAARAAQPAKVGQKPLPAKVLASPKLRKLVLKELASG